MKREPPGSHQYRRAATRFQFLLYEIMSTVQRPRRALRVFNKAKLKGHLGKLLSR